MNKANALRYGCFFNTVYGVFTYIWGCISQKVTIFENLRIVVLLKIFDVTSAMLPANIEYDHTRTHIIKADPRMCVKMSYACYLLKLNKEFHDLQFFKKS